ncbi:MAG: S8 family serine peptidase [Candidatus Margulisbacteria bacterium]|nr:S8 family serine peptidase [Candidatus Margulisiibacteriota bacterium]
MKKIFLLLVVCSLFAVETTGTIKIIKKNGSVYFTKDNKEFQIQTNKDNLKKGTRMSALAVSEYEEEDLPVELFGFVSLATIVDSAGTLVTAKNPANIVVAVIDTGLDTNNRELTEYCLINTKEIPGNGLDDDHNGFIDDYYGVNILENNGNVLDDHGHGTSMFSTIAIQSKGNVKIVPIKAFDSSGCSSQFLIANAIIYAVQRGANVINCSFGYQYSSETLQIAVQYALDHGVIVVAAAGNNGQEIVMYPSGYAGVIAVSSLDDYDRLSYFSNYGDHIKLSCIGERVGCIGVGGASQQVSGTSISSAYIAGTIANINNLSDLSVNEVVRHYSNDVMYPLGNVKPYPGWDKYTGQGKISNILFSESDSTVLAQEGLTIDSLEVASFLNYPNPVVGSGTEFGFDSNKNAKVKLEIYNLAGMKLWQEERNVASGKYEIIPYNLKHENGSELANDSYIAVLRVNDGAEEIIKKTVMTILR